MKAKMYIMCGVAGVGKSTYVNKLKEGMFRSNFVLICPDLIREEICGGDRSDQSKNADVWKLAYERVISAAKHGLDIIFDATMLNPKSRKKLIKIGKEYDMFIEAHAVEKTLDAIIRQNANREWSVPDNIVRSMYERYSTPTIEEGFDAVYVHV